MQFTLSSKTKLALALAFALAPALTHAAKPSVEHVINCSVQLPVFKRILKNEMESSEFLRKVLSTDLYVRFQKNGAPFKRCVVRSRYAHVLKPYRKDPRNQIYTADMESMTDENLSVAVCLNINPKTYPDIGDVSVDVIDHENAHNSFNRAFKLRQNTKTAIDAFPVGKEEKN